MKTRERPARCTTQCNVLRGFEPGEGGNCPWTDGDRSSCRNQSEEENAPVLLLRRNGYADKMAPDDVMEVPILVFWSKVPILLDELADDNYMLSFFFLNKRRTEYKDVRPCHEAFQAHFTSRLPPKALFNLSPSKGNCADGLACSTNASTPSLSRTTYLWRAFLVWAVSFFF